jgi:hypothetical protein
MAAATATVTALFSKDRPLAPQVAAALSAAEARRAELTGQLASLALDEVLSEPGVAAKRQSIERELAGVTAEVERLGHAHLSALRRDRLAVVAARSRALQEQLAEFERIAAARHAAISDLCTHVEAATASYRTFVECNSALLRSFPAGTRRPAGTEQMFGYAEALVAGELYRHGGVAGIGQRGHALPGAKAPHFNTTFNPGAIQSAADTVNALERAPPRRGTPTGLDCRGFEAERIAAA